jgi:hypothetical protein
MGCLLLAAALAPAAQPGWADPAPLHYEHTAFSRLTVFEDDLANYLQKRDESGAVVGYLRHPDGTPMRASRSVYRKLLLNRTLFGSQLAEHDRDFRDDFMMIVPNLTPWDAVAVFGAVHAFDGHQEPLTYYHRTGPVGAIFSELRSRKNGADAKAPVGAVGLHNGAQACYGRPGQSFTFYETDPAIARHTADSDKFFTHVAAARKRGVKVEVRVGDQRQNLAADKDRKFAVLFVDQCESYPVPKELFTVEAVRLYLDRLADDGILAMHISSKLLRLEPVVTRLATEFGLTARIWIDDGDRRPGKAASSWVVMARKPEHLGGLYQPAGDLMFGPPPKPGADDRVRALTDDPVFRGLAAEFAELRGAKEKELNDAKDPAAAWLGWVLEKMGKSADPGEKARLGLYVGLILRHGPSATFREVMVRDHGHAFRRTETRRAVTLWTDARADVLAAVADRRMLAFLRGFGLTLPDDR